MNSNVLQEIGLSQGESKVYLTLLTQKSWKTGQLAKESGVSSSKVYKILDRLIQKGLVGFVLRGKIKYFSALESNRILQYIEEKEKELANHKAHIKELIPQLELQRSLSQEKTNAVLYEGFKSVTNFFHALVDELKKDESYYVIGAGYGNVPGLRVFFHNHHLRRAQKGIKVKMLANYNLRNTLEISTRKNAEIRFLPQYLISNMEIVFYNNKAFIVIWSTSPVGFLVENREVMKGFKKYFDAFWKIGK